MADDRVTSKPPIVRVSCRHGWFHVVATDSVVGLSLIAYGEWTEPEIELLAGYLRPGDDVIDVGAHVGAHTVPFARRISPNGTVLAFEPQALLFEALASGVVDNGLQNVRLFQTACGAAPGSAPAPAIDYMRPGNFGAVAFDPQRAEPSTAAVPVANVALDDVADLHALRLIKVDVEGLELAVLHGAERLIDRYRPILYIESEDPAKSGGLLGFLSRQGYNVFWHAVPLFNPRNFRGQDHNLFAAAHCVNVLALPKERREPRPDLPTATAETHPRRVRLDRARDLNDRTASLLFRRGLDAESRSDKAVAADFYERVLALQPDHDEARVRLEGINRSEQ